MAIKCALNYCNFISFNVPKKLLQFFYRPKCIKSRLKTQDVLNLKPIQNSVYVPNSMPPQTEQPSLSIIGTSLFFWSI